MISRRLKLELMDACEKAVAAYLASERATTFGGSKGKVVRSRASAVMVTGLEDAMTGERLSLELVLEEVR